MNHEIDKISALKYVKEVYLQLKQKEITYKNYRNKIKNIMRRCGSKAKNDEINTDFLYINIEDKKYYAQFFISVDYDLAFIVDINVIDIKQENINKVREAKGVERCFIQYLHSTPQGNFMDYL